MFNFSGFLQSFGKKCVNQGSRICRRLVRNIITPSTQLNGEGYPFFDFGGPVPQQRRSFQRQLAVLGCGQTYKATTRVVAQEGVMVRFIAEEIDFEGLAPFSRMEPSIRAQVYAEQPVTIVIKNPRDSGTLIPELEIVSIDGPGHSRARRL